MMVTRSPATRRLLIRAIARSALSLAVVGAFGRAASGEPLMMSFNDVHPDISLKLFVPDGWSAGRRLQGDRVLSQQPKLVLFGGIGDRDKRVLGELLYFVRSADFDPMVVFAES